MWMIIQYIRDIVCRALTRKDVERLEIYSQFVEKPVSLELI